MSEFERMVQQMITQWRIPREKAEAAARLELNITPRSALEAIRDEALVSELEDDVTENADRMMRSLGFHVVRLSQKRRSKVTAGVPDRYYLHPRLKLALWYEAKSVSGRARPEQLQFQELCRSADVPHVLGGIAQLREWLTTNGVATFDENGVAEPLTLRESA